nr:immunoglobulin light chain junction region [Macaca mulatta]
CGQGTHLVSF